MSANIVTVVSRYCTLQTYCPEWSPFTLLIKIVADPALHCRSVLGSLFRFVFSLVHVIRDKGKLSTLQVRFRTSPSTIVVLPVIIGFFMSIKQILNKKLKKIEVNRKLKQRHSKVLLSSHNPCTSTDNVCTLT